MGGGDALRSADANSGTEANGNQVLPPTGQTVAVGGTLPARIPRTTRSVGRGPSGLLPSLETNHRVMGGFAAAACSPKSPRFTTAKGTKDYENTSRAVRGATSRRQPANAPHAQ